MIAIRTIFALLLIPTSLFAQSNQHDSDEETTEQLLERLRPSEPKPVSPGDLEASIQRGVDFLIKNQRPNGAWGDHQWTGGVDSDPVPGAFRSFEVAVTAMCLEALLDVEQTDVVIEARKKALAFLLKRTSRIQRAGPYDLPNVWAHCYSIQTFTKLIQRTDDESRKKVLSDAIKEHMRGLKRWQSIHGGWFYYGSGMRQPINPSCSFVNAAVLVSLHRARQIGLEADSKMVKKAIKVTGQMRKSDSSFLYTMKTTLDRSGAMSPINRPCGSLGRSQAGNIALRLWGDARIDDDVLHLWLSRMVTRHGWLDMGRKRPIPHESHAAVAGYFYYFGLYYAALCIDELPESERAFYRHHLAAIAMKRQEKDGSWFDYPLYNFHKAYGTAFAIMTLQECRN